MRNFNVVAELRAIEANKSYNLVVVECSDYGAVLSDEHFDGTHFRFSAGLAYPGSDYVAVMQRGPYWLASVWVDPHEGCTFRKFEDLYEAINHAIEATSASSFLDELYVLLDAGELTRAVDATLNKVDKLCTSSRFGEIDLLLKHLDLQKLDDLLLVSLLTATLRTKSYLQERSDFYVRVDQVLQARGDQSENLLSGLK
jgi:hypothetical protein